MTRKLHIDGDPAPHLDDEVTLQYYRLQSVYEGSIKLEDEVGELTNSPKLAMATEDERERLSKILDTLNDRWGTEFTNMDKVLEQVAEDLAQDDENLLRAHNTLDLFKIVYDEKMPKVMLIPDDAKSRIRDEVSFRRDLQSRHRWDLIAINPRQAQPPRCSF
ncbi:hypothetical protein [Arcanobacterium phocae]|uniref:hypothetical protein n=1 Tax=Arcanobacterium phocae TaxID=131112 RepID=UPI00209CE770|nr:hypothetical protein [Arcanobacterium phocae]